MSAPGKRRTGLAACAAPAAVFLFALALYLPSVRNGFVYDDEVLILEQETPGSPAEFARVLAERHFPNLPYYRPVTRATLLLQQCLHGRNAAPFHLFNAMLMGLTGVAAFFALRLPVWGIGRAPAALAALLFVAHPVASSTVYPICSGRETLLPALLMLAALHGHLRGGRSGRATALAGFALALFAKEQAVVLPVAFVAADLLGLTPFQPVRRARPWLGRYWAFVPVLSIYIAFRLSLFGGSELKSDLALDPWRPVLSYLFALQALLMPFVELRYEPPPSVWLSWPRLAIALAATFALGLACIRAGSRPRRAAAFGALWFVAIQFPTANLLVQEARFAERYVFLAAFGLLLPAAALASRHRQQPLLRGIAAAAAAAAVLLCTVISLERAGSFADDMAFAAQWVKTNPHSVIALNNLGNEILKRGHAGPAESHLRRAVTLDPANADAHYNLGIALFKQGRTADAVMQYRTVLELAPDYDAHYNLGLALAKLDRAAEARAAYEQALARDTRHADARYNLGLLLAGQGRTEEAIAQFRAAAEAAPSDADVHYNLGVALEKATLYTEAAAAYRAAVGANDAHTNAHFNLANVAFRLQRFDEAIGHYEAVLRLDPSDAQARNNLQAARRLAGDRPGL